MKIKDEYIGTKVSHKGKRSILDADRFEFYQSIGLGYMFEESTVSEPKVKRPGVHAKSKTSKLKSSKNYKKLYTRQG